MTAALHVLRRCAHLRQHQSARKRAQVITLHSATTRGSAADATSGGTRHPIHAYAGDSGSIAGEVPGIKQ